MSEGTRARGRLMPAPFAMPCRGSCVACCPAGVPGAGGPGCGAGLVCGARPLCVPVGGGPPARSPHASLRLGVIDLEARPGPATAHRHRGQAPRFAARPCPPVPPASSTPVVPGRCCLVRRVLLQTSSIRGVFRVDFCVVVTNVVNPTAFSLKMLVFGLRLTTFVTGVLVRRFELRWFDDVCNVGCPLVAWPGPAAAHGYRIWVL